jgi:hypothetical protein
MMRAASGDAEETCCRSNSRDRREPAREWNGDVRSSQWGVDHAASGADSTLVRGSNVDGDASRQVSRIGITVESPGRPDSQAFRVGAFHRSAPAPRRRRSTTLSRSAAGSGALDSRWRAAFAARGRAVARSASPPMRPSRRWSGNRFCATVKSASVDDGRAHPETRKAGGELIPRRDLCSDHGEMLFEHTINPFRWRNACSATAKARRVEGSLRQRSPSLVLRGL